MTWFGRSYKFPPDAGDGRHDSDHKVISLGIISPILLGCWAMLNLFTHSVWWPARGRPIVVTDALHVTAMICVKLGLAVGLFGQYYMANREEWGRWAQVVTLVGYGGAVVAFVIGSIAFLR